MASNTPKFFEFCADSNDWEVYAERLYQHFTANSIKDENIKVAVLLSSIGQNTYKLIRDLCFPDLPKTKKYNELCEILKSQYQIAPSIWRERKKFYSLKQINEETINEWDARVRNMATKCSFSNQLADILKHKFITGFVEGKTFYRICEEEDTTTLDSLVSIAQKHEHIQKCKINFVSKNSRFPPKSPHSSQPRTMCAHGHASHTQNQYGRHQPIRARHAEFCGNWRLH